MNPEQRRPSWARKGWDVSGLSFTEALDQAQINFEVAICPANAVLPFPDGSQHIAPIPGRFHTYRTDTMVPLGEVGKRYHPVQTRQAQALVEEICGGGWTPEFAGPFNGGRSVFIVGRLPFDTSPEIAPYLALVNSFDGSTGLRLANTPIRPMCTNAVRRTFASARASISIRHTSNLSDRIEMARDALGLSKAYYEKLDREIASLMKVGIDEMRLEQALDLIHEFKPTGTKLDDKAYERSVEKRAEFISHWESTPTIPNEHRHTGWGLLQASTEYEQWFSKNSHTDRFQENLLGTHLGLIPALTKGDRVQRLVLSWA